MTTSRTSHTSKSTSSHCNTIGSVRKLPSGRFQVRFTDARMERHTAPVTSPGRREAEDYLATIRADMVRGLGKPPEPAAITLADCIASLLSVRVDLAPKTLQLYEELARLWINADHQLPSPSARGGAVRADAARDGAGRTRTINLGERSWARSPWR